MSMTNEHYTVRVAVAPGGNIEDVRDAINRVGGAIALEIEADDEQ